MAISSSASGYGEAGDTALGEWKGVRLGDIFEHVVDAGHTDELPILSVTLREGVVHRSSLPRKSGREVPREKHLRVAPGDIAYNTMRMWQGASGLICQDGYLSPAYTVCRVRPGESAEYWAHSFKSRRMIKAFLNHSQGLTNDRLRLYFKHFATVPAIRPPLPEQRKIAAILSSVDEVIEKTEGVIEQLQVVKKAMLQELLTRGLPGRHTRFKQTEIGEIPEEWEVVLLDTVARRGSGHTPDKKHPEYWDGEVKWVSLKDSSQLDRLYISDSRATITPKGIANSSAVEHPSGTVVLSRDAGVGKSAIMTDAMAVSQHFMAWSCGPTLDNHFLYYWLQSMKREFERIAIGSTIKTIGLPYFKKLLIPLPPLDEQQVAAEALTATELRIFAEQSAVGELQAVKQALMSVLLTGKLRVTPDEAAA